MSVTAKLSFCIASSDPDLRMVVRLDDTVIYNNFPTTEKISIEHDFDDAQEREHLLVFELQGKLPEHTQIDDKGEILQDRYVTITDVAFDDMSLGHLFTESTFYHHDTNGTTAPVTEPFYGIMGCNGRAEMRFSTPVYLWLLESM